MSVSLYFSPYSTRCLSVKVVLKLTNTEFQERAIDVLKGENLKEAFTNINPNQTVPAITEGFFSLFESHAIMKYICRNNSSLYPTDLHKRALIDQYMDWHHIGFSGLMSYVKECYVKPLIIGNKVPEDRVQKLVDAEETLTFFQKTFLKDHHYLMGQESYTIADIRAVCDLGSLFIANFDFEKFPLIKHYIQRMFKIPELIQSHKEMFALINKQKYKNSFIQSITTNSPQQQHITLYFHPFSSPSRAVRSLLLLAKIDFNERIIDLLKQENLSESYTALNPNQSVPFIKQGDFGLFESHAQMKYICDQYRLINFYPQELQIKAQIDSYLDFHHCQMKSISTFVMKYHQSIPPPEEIKQINELLELFIKIFLGDGQFKYIANCKQLTIADLSAFHEILYLVKTNYEFVPVLQKYITNILGISAIKTANKEFLSILNAKHIVYNAFNKSLVTQRRIGCC